jgi:hypothetical protein
MASAVALPLAAGPRLQPGSLERLVERQLSALDIDITAADAQLSTQLVLSVEKARSSSSSGGSDASSSGPASASDDASSSGGGSSLASAPGGAAGGRPAQLSSSAAIAAAEALEPILRDNPDRFSMFPLQ